MVSILFCLVKYSKYGQVLSGVFDSVFLHISIHCKACVFVLVVRVAAVAGQGI